MSIESLQAVPIREFLETRPLFSEGDRVTRAIGYFRRSGEYEIFVEKEKRLATVTVRDLLGVKNPETTKLGSVVYLAPHLGEGDSVGRAARLLFDYRLRALPASVVQGEARVVSARGLIQRISESSGSRITASDVMTPSPITLEVDDKASKARLVMIRKSIDHLPVVSRTKLQGMLTSSLLLFNLLPEEGAHRQDLGESSNVRLDFPAKSIAEDATVQVDAGARLSEVIRTMLNRKSSYALTMLWDELQGIVTLRDIVRLLAKRESSRLPYYIVGLPKEPFEAEAAKMKFERLGTSLSKAFPSIQEVRSIVKVKETGGERKRYEVHVNVYTPRDAFAYSEGGYELPNIFDAIAPKLKRLLSSRSSKVTRAQGRTLRKMQ